MKSLSSLKQTLAVISLQNQFIVRKMAFRDRSGDVLIQRSRAEHIHLTGIFQAGVFLQQLRFFCFFFIVVISFERCFSCQQCDFFTLRSCVSGCPLVGDEWAPRYEEAGPQVPKAGLASFCMHRLNSHL